MTDGRFLKETALTEQRLSQIRALNDLAAQRGQTLAQMDDSPEVQTLREKLNCIFPAPV